MFFAYQTWTDESILMIVTPMIDIDKIFKLTIVQGHKIKGQGQIYTCVKNLKNW